MKIIGGFLLAALVLAQQLWVINEVVLGIGYVVGVALLILGTLPQKQKEKLDSFRKKLFGGKG